jgi:hypothetical protein
MHFLQQDILIHGQLKPITPFLVKDNFAAAIAPGPAPMIATFLMRCFSASAIAGEAAWPPRISTGSAKQSYKPNIQLNDSSIHMGYGS